MRKLENYSEEKRRIEQVFDYIHDLKYPGSIYCDDFESLIKSNKMFYQASRIAVEDIRDYLDSGNSGQIEIDVFIGLLIQLPNRFNAQHVLAHLAD